MDARLGTKTRAAPTALAKVCWRSYTAALCAATALDTPDPDDVAAYLRRWLLVDDTRARQAMRFIASPLWRAYTSTYIEGYRLLRGWLDDRPAGVGLAERFGTLLDEPLIPSTLPR